ncbi:hypothetical protein BZZ01_13340 [Nostocales cyanobacterium HT-58-2]|nr:hypothetical protein BZZ01_13340 [Nostocales cyanobacterium HT-58-2]
MDLSNPGPIISAVAAPIIKDKLQRSEVVIELLKRFKLSPDHPPSNFSGVYAYALVEYGVGKPKPFLELFRHNKIKQAFRKAFDDSNSLILQSEVDKFVDAYALGDEIKTLGLDIKREVAAFTAVFIEVVNRSRTPADTMMQHQIVSLHRKVETITEQVERLGSVDISRVYLYAVKRKMEADIKAERTFTSLADKLYFLCELSWEMLSTDKMSLNYRLFPDRIRQLFGDVVRAEKDLDYWHFDMMGQTMLIRNAEGDYTPAHRSLLEFFVAYKFAAELGTLAEDFTELAQAQSHLDKSAAPQDYTWSSYFQQRMDETGKILRTPPLQKFAPENIANLHSSFGQVLLTKAVIDLLLPMLIPLPNEETMSFSYPLFNILELTREKSRSEVGFICANVVMLLAKLNSNALKDKDINSSFLSNTSFSSADLSNTNLSYANLSNADLSNTNLSYANLSNADLSNTNLSNANLSDANLSNANLSNANLDDANLTGADLSHSIIRGASFKGTNISGTNLQNVTR